MEKEKILNNFYEDDLNKLEEELWRQLQLLNKYHDMGVNFNDIEKEILITKAKSQLIALLEQQSKIYQSVRASQIPTYKPVRATEYIN